MKKNVLIFAAAGLFSFQALAINAPVTPNDTVAIGISAAFPNGCGNVPRNVFNSVFRINIGGFTARTANNVLPFYKNGTAYQVTAGLKAYCVCGAMMTVTPGNSIQLMWDTATFVANATTASLTAPKYEGLTAGNWTTYLGAAAYAANPIGSFTFPASSWPGIQNSATDNHYGYLYCYEAL